MLLAAPMVHRPLTAVMTRTDGPALNGALAGTGALLAAFSLLLTLGLLLATLTMRVAAVEARALRAARSGSRT